MTCDLEQKAVEVRTRSGSKFNCTKLDNAMYDSTKLGITAKLSTLQVLSQEPMS
jgi:hypothetical protein